MFSGRIQVRFWRDIGQDTIGPLIFEQTCMFKVPEKACVRVIRRILLELARMVLIDTQTDKHYEAAHIRSLRGTPVSPDFAPDAEPDNIAPSLRIPLFTVVITLHK